MNISASNSIVTKLISTGFNGAVSDTGIGSCLQEFQNLKLSIGSVADEQWGKKRTKLAVLSIIHYKCICVILWFVPF